MNVIALANQKGGVGKSTVSVELAFGLARRGNRVLLIDLDPQCDSTWGVTGQPIDENRLSAFDVMTDPASIVDAVNTGPGCFFVQGSSSLGYADQSNVLHGTRREYRIKDAMEHLKAVEQFDFIILDTPPSLGIVTVNVLLAATHLVVPMQASPYPLRAVQQLKNTVDEIQTIRQAAGDAPLKVAGILLTLYEERTIINQELREKAAEAAKAYFDSIVFDAQIRKAKDQETAQAFGISVVELDKNSKVASDYEAFVDELIAKEKF